MSSTERTLILLDRSILFLFLFIYTSFSSCFLLLLIIANFINLFLHALDGGGSN